MPVLVTGATGLLGSHLVDLLIERGESVRALVRPGEGTDCWARAGVDICRGDLSDRASLEAAVHGVDRVLHCAARTGVWGPRREYEITNIQGLESLLKVALAAGVRRFVHVSSIAVLGADVRGVADETSPVHIDPNPYSWSKVMGERLLERMLREHETPVTIVRSGWIYGPRDVASFARFASLIERGRMVLIGSGNNHLPLIYVTDVARGILLAGEAAEAVGRTYVLVNDEPVTQLQYVGAIATELGVPAPNRHFPRRLALILGAVAEGVGHISRRGQPPPLTRYGVQLLGGENRFVIQRARRELGFSPEVNLAQGVQWSVAWYRSRHSVNSAREEK
ncbi:MAG: NAD-dependent epimerase/dehydratase family protein [Acidobacteriia bacterium]|nr:NAD-dependent epimerase/dehydratase family protein [Terriglobia bacterium]